MADKSLNKTELVAKIAASTGQSQATVDSVLGGLFDALAESVGSGTKVSIPGWLAVERTHRPQPADGCYHRHPGRLLGQGVGGLEAQGCRQVAFDLRRGVRRDRAPLRRARVPAHAAPNRRRCTVWTHQTMRLRRFAFPEGRHGARKPEARGSGGVGRMPRPHAPSGRTGRAV